MPHLTASLRLNLFYGTKNFLENENLQPVGIKTYTQFDYVHNTK